MDPVFFDDRDAFRDWLAANHETEDVCWVGYYKADADREGIAYAESVEEAVCFGWIDGLIHGIDDETYARRFTPRTPDSRWSKANVERVRVMVDAGRMTPAGLAAVEAAKASGAWTDAYRLADDHDLPEDLETALRADDAAWEHFQAFSNTDQHAFIAQVEAARTEETRTRRIERTVALAARDERAFDDENRSRL